jgi:hypothetical protein
MLKQRECDGMLEGSVCYTRYTLAEVFALRRAMDFRSYTQWNT